MADDSAGEKTEPATPRKRQETREKGQVARSQDLSTAVLLLGAFVLIYILSNGVIGKLAGIFRRSFTEMGQRLTFDHVVAMGRIGFQEIGLLLAPMLGALFAIAFLVNLLQVGWRVSLQPLTPDITKLSPIKGLKRIFSMRGMMRLLFGILKLVIIGVVIYLGYASLLASDNPDHLLATLHRSLPDSVAQANSALFKVGGQACLALLILAILDFSFQRWQHEKDLRMSKQEIKEEMKRMEGDPRLKERRRRMAQQLALQRMMHDVPKADVVITNPTHYACAIQYTDGDMAAPRLLAKGVDHLAMRIRRCAKDNDIPIHEEPPLARSIHALTEVGHEIPSELYSDVARVLAYVYRLGGKGERKTEGVGA